uniref:Uncharacterized protein n=1 Tax=Oryza punctata TaxID=4537 RepID=A0A0E0JGZ5_ORYPU
MQELRLNIACVETGVEASVVGGDTARVGVWGERWKEHVKYSPSEIYVDGVRWGTPDGVCPRTCQLGRKKLAPEGVCVRGSCQSVGPTHLLSPSAASPRSVAVTAVPLSVPPHIHNAH